MNNSRVVENCNINSSLSNLPAERHSHDGDNENSSDEEVKIVNEKSLKKAASDAAINANSEKNGNVNQLSKSLGATDINTVTSDDDEPFSDAQAEPDQTDTVTDSMDQSKNVFVSAAMSIDYPNCPPSSKYIRGDNLVSCWAMRPDGNDDKACIFEWLLCIDLKGSLPKYVLNTVSLDFSFNQT